MHDYFSRFFKCTLVALAFSLQLSASQYRGVDHTPKRLANHIPTNAVTEATFLKKLDGSIHIPITFTLPLRNQKELEELLDHLYNPNHEDFGKYLTSEEFAERFSPTEEDYNTVIAYANGLGLKITGTHSNRLLLHVSGPTDTIEAAFDLQLHQYQKHDGRVFYAPDRDPEVPTYVTSLIDGIVGLDNHAIWRSFNRQKEITEKILIADTTPNAHPSGPAGGYAPTDILLAYNLNEVSAKGTGQAIALFELGGYQVSDINTYTKQFGLPNAQLKNIVVDSGPSGGINPEVTLDIELALAIAPESQILVYEGPNSGQGVLHTYNRIATDNLAKQVSTSWGLGENLSSPQFLQAESAIFQQMAAHGQTIFAAAGDSGAFDNFPTSQDLVVDDPASQPKVVGVGGTKLTVNPATGAYVAEQVWNNGLGRGAGGGGVSTVWPLPNWQKNVRGLASTTHRNVPDVALNSDTNSGYSIFHGGKWVVFGGTSCAAPLWAAFVARVNQQLVANQKPVLGFPNNKFYKIGKGATYTNNFHDVATGDNLHYQAHKGYDNASGWGSFNGAELFNTLTGAAAK